MFIDGKVSTALIPEFLLELPIILVVVVMQMGSATFDVTGFAMFGASAVLEALRVVLVQLLMTDLKYNAAEVSHYHDRDHVCTW